ncbi:hypothetical protein [Tardiphaga sp.]|uniref:hypothetical protein n=1 Tax=Tardiphaga sp. TaxID=1926292 RepID=UPI00352A22A0
MKETPERDRGLLGLVERIMRRPGDPEQIKPKPDADADTRDGFDPIVAEDSPAASLEPQLAVESTRTLSRLEIADVILRALKGIDGCPTAGFEVIVYGTKPWNAMLRITPAAGAVPDARAWRQRVQDMVQLLRHQYELRE